ncbi:Acid-sensing ion channel 1 [Holothuria leucospilota]|uniref:Acid-sensing ion channel 1 n=1 Tax=Holothuria leucospilota TaxID=206669 RepID=A0A9Q1BJG6_HOLLE|nr:Acid-sensing ion channel 1 [Holothuria leucospilota]
MHYQPLDQTRQISIKGLVLWTVLLVCLMVWLAYGIIQGVQKYFSYPVSTVIDINYVRSLDFPAVTICNYNQFRKSKIMHDKEIIQQVLVALATGNSSNVDWETYDETYANHTFNLTKTTLEYGHQIEDMLIECRWNTGEECGTENLTQVITDFGLCYTFNGKTSERRLTVSRAGATRGLKLRLSVQQDEYFWGDNTGAGFKVLVHTQGEMPLVNQLGNSISPGFETLFAIRSIIKFYNFSRKEFYTQSDICECPVPCKSEFYLTSLSMGFWPSDFIGENIARSKNETKEYIRDNYLELRIFYDILTIEKISQAASYNALDLQSKFKVYFKGRAHD